MDTVQSAVEFNGAHIFLFIHTLSTVKTIY